MDSFRDKKSADDRSIEDEDSADRNLVVEDDASDSNESSSGTGSSMNPSIGRRLTQILVEDGDADLLLQRSDREDFLQWLRALDFQVMGACRADERLEPFLMLNVSTGMAEDRLLSHLSQHFEPSEVGILARCLCIPLVSIRAGKINKSGTILYPTSTRGNLCLTLLPTSDLRISFNGDDGSTERLVTFSRVQSTTIEIEEISADISGRSFLIKISDSAIYYFWCSEKSKLLGDELLKNMKDLLIKKPSLAELTGISEARLSCFASHLRSYLSGSAITNAQISGALPVTTSSDSTVNSSGIQFSQSSLTCQKNSRFRHYPSLGSKTNLTCQGSLSPKSSSFKEGLPKNLSSTRIITREKLKRRVENYAACVDSLDLTSTSKCDRSNSNISKKDKVSKRNESLPLAELSFLDAFGKSSELPFSGSEMQFASSCSSHLSSHRCRCPPTASGLQCSIENSQLPVWPVESPSLPSLSSLLSGTRQSRQLASKPSISMIEIPPFNFPFSAEPLVRLPTSQQIPTFTPLICPLDFPFFPEPLARQPSSQQFPSFTPLICDPIVHIPVIDVYSSGQGYLVSAGPALSTTIPPLNSNLVDPLPEAESVLEKGARETLRMLISNSNQTNDVFPSVLSSNGDKPSVLSSSGSRGMYSGTIDVDVLTHSLKTMGLALLSENPTGSKICSNRDDLDDEEKSSSSDTSYEDGFDY